MAREIDPELRVRGAHDKQPIAGRKPLRQRAARELRQPVVLAHLLHEVPMQLQLPRLSRVDGRGVLECIHGKRRR